MRFIRVGINDVESITKFSNFKKTYFFTFENVVYINVNVYERLEHPYPEIWCSVVSTNCTNVVMLVKEVNGALLVKYSVVNTIHPKNLCYGASE